MARTDEDKARRVPARIFWTLVSTSLLAVAAIVGIALWMSDATNTVSDENSERLIESALSAEMERVVISTWDYAQWNEAYEWLAARDDETIYSSLGTGATDDQTFDLIYLLAADGTPLYAYQTDGEGSDLSLVDADIADTFVNALADIPLEPYELVPAYVRIDGQFAIVSAGRVQPDDITGLRANDLDIMVGGLWLTDEKLQDLAARLLLEDLRIMPAGAPLTEGAGLQILRDINGNPIAQLTWTTPRPGDLLLRRAVPVIIALSLILLSASAIIGRTSAHQTAAFLRERSVARTDQLTGLLNRAGLEELVQSPQVQPALANGRAALIYLDLNGFKELNDTVGHDAGDLALQITAERLVSAIRGTDFVARLGGDEFVCLLLDASPSQAAEYVAKRIIARTTPAIHIGNSDHVVRPSIGIAIADRGQDWHSLVVHADIAMYHAKGKNLMEPVFYISGMGRADRTVPKQISVA